MIYAAVDGNIADLRHLADCAVEVLAPVAAGTKHLSRLFRLEQALNAGQAVSAYRALFSGTVPQFSIQKEAPKAVRDAKAEFACAAAPAVKARITPTVIASSGSVFQPALVHHKPAVATPAVKPAVATPAVKPVVRPAAASPAVKPVVKAAAASPAVKPAAAIHQPAVKAKVNVLQPKPSNSPNVKRQKTTASPVVVNLASKDLTASASKSAQTKGTSPSTMKKSGIQKADLPSPAATILKSPSTGAQKKSSPAPVKRGSIMSFFSKAPAKAK